MSDYRFHLEKYRPGSKVDCPRCQRHRCFNRYVDEHGLVTFPSHVGRCDHESSCGYHFTPKMHFADHPLVEPKGLLMAKSVATPRVELPSVMETALMEKTLTAYPINPLYRWMSVVMGEEGARELFLLYNVGTSKAWGGSAVFWQVDVNGNVRAGKVMGYDPKTGHRVKEPDPQVAWVHSLKKINLDLKQCLFGEHLLGVGDPEQQVIIVESEKSALIGAWKMPDYVWLATGGIQMLRPTQALSGRDVMLIPDLGAEDTWRAKMEQLRPVCKSVTLSDCLSKIATDEQRQQGLDIADFILMEPTATMVIEDIKTRYRELDDFIIGLQLTPSSTFPGMTEGLGEARGKTSKKDSNSQSINLEKAVKEQGN